MDGLIYLLDEAGKAVQQLKQLLAQKDARIAELETELAAKDRASKPSSGTQSSDKAKSA